MRWSAWSARAARAARVIVEDDHHRRIAIRIHTANGLTGRGTVVPQPGGNSATIWFFSPDNAEVLVKVLDNCGFSGSPAYWVFFAATTNVDFTLRVTDTHTGLTKEYKNLLGQAAPSVQDTATFRTCGR